jgi:hypothetical protein
MFVSQVVQLLCPGYSCLTRYPDTGDLPCRRSGGRNVAFWLPCSGDRRQLIIPPEILTPSDSSRETPFL